MPAREVMKLYREGRLHSGTSGKVVLKKNQARAIMLSYLRKEGRPIPGPQK